MSKPIAVRMDDKGRVHIPRALRKTLQTEPGDLFFVQLDADEITLRRAPNPFDTLAEAAMRDADRHETISLETLLPPHDR